MALIFTLPLLFWVTIVPESQFSARWNRIVMLGAVFISCYVQIFLLFVAFFFFEEFKSRFNTVAVDYLIYPQEVFVNIWESYHVGLIFVLCLLSALGWVLLAAKLFGRMWERPFSTTSRWLHLGAAVAVSALLALPLISLRLRPLSVRL